MPRTYKRVTGKKSRRVLDAETLRKALESVQKGMSVAKAAKKFNIGYTSLSKRLKNPDMADRVGPGTALSPMLERSICNRLITCANWGYPLDLKELQTVITEYLNQNDHVIPQFKNNVPGRDYLHAFLNRHKDILSLRLCSNIKRSRAAVNRATIGEYFQHLQQTLESVPSENIFNYDETNFTDDPGNSTVLAKRSSKYVERIMNTSKTATSVMFCASATCVILPPYFVYKATHMYNTWIEGGPAAARYNRSKSGWFESNSFLDWIRTIAVPYLRRVEGKKVLIGDNLSSHISLEALLLCEVYDIHFVFLPANSTHLLQPLDVAVYSSLKTNWRVILLDWKKHDGQTECTIPKHVFPKLLKRLMDKVQGNMPANVISGFRKCGIHPLNSNAVLDRLPKENTEQTEENTADSLENPFIQFLKALRPTNTNVRQTKKKMNVQPGKSVSMDDLNVIEPQPGPSGVTPPSRPKRGHKPPPKRATRTAKRSKIVTQSKAPVAQQYESSYLSTSTDSD